MALYLNIGRGIDPERNQGFRIRVRSSNRISECCTRLRALRRDGIGRTRNHIIVENDNVIVTGMFGNCNIVPDVYRYDIRRRQNEFTLLPPRNVCGVNPLRHSNYHDLPATNDGIDTLVVVVESPHKDEYRNENLSCPIAAAQGNTIRSTGYGIEHHLSGIVNRIACYIPNMENEYRVIIVNPIPWQASLSSLHEQSPRRSPWKNLRDAVWKALWNIDIVRGYFLTRLNDYNPSIVVNACTGGKGRYGLNAIMDQAICSVVPDANLRPRTPHPSLWHQPSKRRIYPRE